MKLSLHSTSKADLKKKTKKKLVKRILNWEKRVFVEKNEVSV